MRGQDFLGKMELIDPAYVQAADSEQDHTKHHRIGWKPLVLCAAILCIMTTTVMATGLGSQLIRLISTKEESGYEVSFDTAKIPIHSLSSSLREVEEKIRQQYATHQPYYNWLPSLVYKKFTTLEDAARYLGYAKLQILQWDIPETETDICFSGDSEGRIDQISLETGYIIGNIRLQAFTLMYTEFYSGEFTFGTSTTESLEFTESLYTTQNQLECRIVKSGPLESGYYGQDGYLTADGLVYNLHIAYLEEDAPQADSLMRQWAEQFR